MNASIAVQVLPIVDDPNEVIRIVDHAIAYIDSTGVNYQVGATESTLEGDYEQLMDILHALPLEVAKITDIPVKLYTKINYAPSGDVLSIAKKTDKYLK